MDGMDWLVAEQTLEEELLIERHCRSVQDLKDIEIVQRMCISLIRQNSFQQKLLAQAVNRIAYLETQLICEE
tara:strand:- start:1104 stop:1319 length:216 start_codon:yes stop_codon:yes gene_type:complete